MINFSAFTDELTKIALSPMGQLGIRAGLGGVGGLAGAGTGAALADEGDRLRGALRGGVVGTVGGVAGGTLGLAGVRKLIASRFGDPLLRARAARLARKMPGASPEGIGHRIGKEMVGGIAAPVAALGGTGLAIGADASAKREGAKPSSEAPSLFVAKQPSPAP